MSLPSVSRCNVNGVSCVGGVTHSWCFVSTYRYGFTFLGMESKKMKIMNRNNDIET